MAHSNFSVVVIFDVLVEWAGPKCLDLSQEDAHLDPCLRVLIDVPYIRTNPSSLLAHRDAGKVEVHRIFLLLAGFINDLHCPSFVSLSFVRRNFLEDLPGHRCQHNGQVDYFNCSVRVMLWASAVP